MLLTVLIVLCAVGLVLWAVNTYVPMQAGVLKLLNVSVLVILIVWLLKISGALAALGRVHL